MPVDFTDATCPRCGADTGDATSMTGRHERPEPGDVSFCSRCGIPQRFTATGLELIPDDELAELRQDRKFARGEILGKLIAAGLHEQASGEPLEIVIEHPGHDEERPHTHTVTALPVDIDPEDPEMAEHLHDMIGALLTQMRVKLMGQEIRKWVTPEVAHHVLSSYGNEHASMPSVATGALISLIRLCHQSDDMMLHNLDSVEDFHGYVLAIVMLAEKNDSDDEEGMALLEMIAGLRDVPKKETDEATAGSSVR